MSNLYELSRAAEEESSAVVAKLDPAQQRALAKLLKRVVKHYKAQYCFIEDSHLGLWAGGGRLFVSADLGSMLKGKISLDFGLLSQTADVLDLFQGSEDTTYEIDEDGATYTVSDGNTREHVNRALDSKPQMSLPVTEGDWMGEEIDNIAPQHVKRIPGKSIHKYLYIYGNQLEQVGHEGHQPFSYNAQAGHQLRGQQPDLRLLSTFYGEGVTGKTMSLRLAKNEHGYWLVTTFTEALGVAVKTYELLIEP